MFQPDRVSSYYTTPVRNSKPQVQPRRALSFVVPPRLFEIILNHQTANSGANLACWLDRQFPPRFAHGRARARRPEGGASFARTGAKKCARCRYSSSTASTMG